MQNTYAVEGEHTRSDSMRDDCMVGREDINRVDSRKSVRSIVNGKYRSFLSLCGVIGSLFILLLIPFSRGEAQTDTWTPAWVDLSDTGVIHIIGLDTDSSSKESPVSTTNQVLEKHGVLDNVKQFFSSFTRSFVAHQDQITDWSIIFSDDLEGTFPGDWDVFDNDGSIEGEYFWAKKNCRTYEGSYSAWVVGGGAEGSELSCNSDYPTLVQSWMIYGPFSLEEATDAEFIFMYWLNSEPGFDFLYVGASIDGSNFYGEASSGIQDWTEKNFDLTDIYTLGDVTGESAVWVAITFQSDESINYPEGVYVDNIELRQYIAGEPTPTSTPDPENELRFLPLILRNFPFIPNPPVLNTISNGDGDGNYTVSWNSSTGATTYTLEEDDNSGFSSPVTAYSGAGLSKAISGRAVGTYYYRVRASNSSGSSAWSNIVSVQVTQAPPECPQAGEWTGTTSQGGSIHFTVENSPQCQVTSLGLTAHNCFPGDDYFVPVIWIGWEFPIIDSNFTTGPGSAQATGSFSSYSTAEGNFSVKFTRPDPYPWECYSTGTWTAHP